MEGVTEKSFKNYKGILKKRFRDTFQFYIISYITNLRNYDSLLRCQICNRKLEIRTKAFRELIYF